MNASALAKRRLGRTGFEVTPIGMGGAHLGKIAPGSTEWSDELAVAAVHRGLELGINVIDPSPMYGERQRRIGLALAQWRSDEVKREDIIISTKTGQEADGARDYSAAATRRSVQISLELLQTDYIDILLVHDPHSLGEALDPGNALEALLECKEQGLIRAIGLGCRPHEFHRACIESGQFDMSLTFCDYNLIDQSAAEGVLATAAEHDVGVYNGTVIMLGLLGGEDPREVARRRGGFATEERLQRATALWEWCRARDVSLPALSLQFSMREPRIATALVGVRAPEHLEANVAAISEDIPAEVWEELEEEFFGA